jgi:hypothetical protein
MKKCLLTFGLLATLSTSYAQLGLIEEQVYISGHNKKLIKLIESHPELTLDHMSADGFELYGPKGMKAWLDQLKVNYSEEADHAHQEKTDAEDFLNYPSFNQITTFLKDIAAKYPHITKLESIGKSVEGRDLWVLKISDNPKLDEVEPEFKYISSMHGDEITGRELMQFFIKDLVEGYNKDKRITDLINNTEIYIMPSMNPDGSEKRQRANANRVDLNRNFPHWNAEVNDKNGRQPETLAVMDFQAKRQFALSANFHGGAVCVNYPWDSTKVRHPFDGLIRDLSLRYSIENGPMYNSREFSQGITNGADWYVVRGGMQDWSYVFYNDLQVTVELSDTKWPSYSNIPRFYEENKEALMVYAEAIHQGAGFKLKTKADGKVSIKQLANNRSKKDIGTYAFRSGEFFKVLDAGSYEFTVEAQGKKYTFETEVTKGMMMPNGNYTQL